MEKKERDTWDDLFRSKLQDFEVDTLPEDWEAIAGRLEEKKIVPFRRTLRYWAAAAVVALLVVTGSIYMDYPQKPQKPVAGKVIQETGKPDAGREGQKEEIVTVVESARGNQPVLADALQSSARKRKAIQAVPQLIRTERLEKEASTDTDSKETAFATNESETDLQMKKKEESPENRTRLFTRSIQREEQKADESFGTASDEIKKEKRNNSRKWGFGMGGGSVSAGSDNSLNTYAFKNTTNQDLELMNLNSPYFDQQAAKTDIRHKTPVTAGLSVSRYLNKRFSLQSGITYTFLSSEWETNGTYQNVTKQKLHFIGIPLSLSYKIAEWQQVQFYAAAGGMMEINVAGRLDTKRYSEGKVFKHQREKIRMDDLLWSVNARVGASYPVFRFMSLYAEAGIGYYFDNHSPIETIRSEKPFNVNLQAGFRFGF